MMKKTLTTALLFFGLFSIANASAISDWITGMGLNASSLINVVATSTPLTIGNLVYWTGTGLPATIGSVATSSETCTSPISCTAHTVLSGGGAITLNTVPLANGGTNATAFTTTGNVVYYDGTRLVTAPASASATLPYASSTSISVSSQSYFTGGFLSSASSTLQDFTGLNATTTRLSVSKIGVSVGTTTTVGALNLGTSAANGTTTITMGRIQFDGYNSAGVKQCVLLNTANVFVVVAGKCANY